MSEIKVNKISPRTACGTTTLGDSGDTFTIPAGVSITNSGTASGFGATGSASWNTTVKTSTFTAVVGEGYFVNTTGGAVTVNLPAGTAGDVIAVKDYAKTFDTNACTVSPNGSEKIGGVAASATLATEGQSITLVYIDSTQGWLVTDSGLQSDASTATFICASVSGACNTLVTVCTNYKVATFTGPGTFTVNSVGNACGSNTVDYLVVAGGGAGGSTNGSSGSGGGGGGAGGYRESPGAASGCYSVSPLGAAPAAALPVSATGYPIVVGAGGATRPFPAGPGNSASNPGNVSSFSTISSAGGGGGSNFTTVASGGSGGGGVADGGVTITGGAGNTPPVNPAQGMNGGPSTATASHYGAGGGGGAITVGSPGTGTLGGTGGPGATSSITGASVQRAGGGGGGTYNGGPSEAAGGAGGGGKGSSYPKGDNNVAGTDNTGGGGGGIGSNAPGSANYSGKAGGSGIVVIRYKFQ